MAAGDKANQQSQSTGAGTSPPAPPPPAETPPAAEAHGGDDRNRFRGIKFTVEFTPENNARVACPVGDMKREFRGRWSNSARSLKNRVPDDRFADMPDLPGVHLSFDGEARTVKIHDPLNDRANKETLTRARRAYKQQFGSEPDPEDDREKGNLSADRMKDWCYWARRWLDLGWVTVISGTVPAMPVVEKLPGRVERNTYDNSPRRDRYPDEKPEYEAPDLSERIGR